MPLCELELEHLEGPTQALFALARAWCAHGGWSLDTRSKALRGSLLADGRGRGPALRAADPHFGGTLHDGPALLRAVLRAVLGQVLGNASELAAGSADADHVHQLRIGLRRLRTALRELAALAPAGIDAGWEAPLSRTFARLGELRDDQALAEAVRPQLERAGAPRCQWRMQEAAADAASIVRDPDFQAALLDVLCFAHRNDGGDAGASAGPDHEQALDHMARCLSRLHRQVIAGGKSFVALPLAEQHRVRKRLKRLRYLAEFVRPLAERKAAQRYLKRLAPAQEALGTHNDVAVASDKFRADAEHDPAAWFAAGYLQAQLADTARAAHEALAPLADAPRFWRRWRRKHAAARVADKPASDVAAPASVDDRR
jgi:CHAD domain-containing protein